MDNPEIENLVQRYSSVKNDPCEIKCFADFPLSRKTVCGLTDLNFIHPTGIQRKSIGLALNGADIVGSAITGSGKTLAFLIPVLEHLYINKWSNTDGVGAIIISPTRELAFQTFETLKKIGKYHDFSAGLIIGGKNLKFERKRMDRCNILICTPGRLLQHMDENPLFDASNMKVLVLDEADRCLDMGFEKAINAIIENLPPHRQTLLFSATQTQSVKDLARLSLNDPKIVGLNTSNSTPCLLQQNYVVVSLENKLTMLWSFIKSHLKQKCIIFLTSCKQVKYMYEIFCKLRPGTNLLALYGTLHQDRRIAIYNEFTKKSNVILFATDIASRGLDFPSINWVVQLDCPEDIKQYIHRAGRSARNNERGESLLVLMPSEEHAMVNELTLNSINIKKIQIDTKKMFSPRVKIEAFLAQNPELKATAKRAFVSYIKAVHNMKNKEIFKVTSLNFEEFAKSLGLVVTPRIRFMDKFKRQCKNSVSNMNNNTFWCENLNSESDSEQLFTVKKNDIDIEKNLEIKDSVISNKNKRKIITKVALAKKSLKKNILPNTSSKFNDDGSKLQDLRKEMRTELSTKYMDIAFNEGINIETSRKLLSEEDKFDKQRFKEKVKTKHRVRYSDLKKIEHASCSNVNNVSSSELSYAVEKKENAIETLSNCRKSTNKKERKFQNSSKLTLHDIESIAAEIICNDTKF